jgi:acyl dehydratase
VTDLDTGKQRLFFDDLRAGEVRELGSFSFTQEDIIEFAERWDPHTWHVDEAAAIDSFFGGIVASGVHTFAAFSSLMTSKFLSGVAVSAGREITLQFKAPVRPEQEIHVRVTTTDLQDVPHRPDQGLVLLFGESLAADGTVVMTVRLEVLVARRPAGA